MTTYLDLLKFAGDSAPPDVTERIAERLTYEDSSESLAVNILTKFGKAAARHARKSVTGLPDIERAIASAKHATDGSVGHLSRVTGGPGSHHTPDLRQCPECGSEDTHGDFCDLCAVYVVLGGGGW